MGRCQTSQQHTIMRTFLACIIHPLGPTRTKMNRPLAFSKGHAREQVGDHKDLELWRVAQDHALRVDQPWRSGNVSGVSSQRTCYILRNFCTSNNIVPCRCREFFDESWHHSRPPSDHERETLLQHGSSDFITWFQKKVPTNLALTKFDVPSCLISFLSCLNLQCQRDVSISAELR